MRNSRAELERNLSQDRDELLADLIDGPSIVEGLASSYPELPESMEDTPSAPTWDEEVVQESHREIDIRAWRAASGRQF